MLARSRRPKSFSSSVSRVSWYPKKFMSSKQLRKRRMASDFAWPGNPRMKRFRRVNTATAIKRSSSSRSARQVLRYWRALFILSIKTVFIDFSSFHKNADLRYSLYILFQMSNSVMLQMQAAKGLGVLHQLPCGYRGHLGFLPSPVGLPG